MFLAVQVLRSNLQVFKNMAQKRKKSDKFLLI